MSNFALAIRDVAEQTGLAEATLRAWEQRYGFPSPERLPSGHRRYDAADVATLRRAAALRGSGMSAPAAIARAQEGGDDAPASVFATIRRLRPDLPVQRLPKRALVRLSHAIEDECTYGARNVALIGAFQHERHYRASQRRWRELSDAAPGALVFADFARVRRPRRGPVEIPLGASDPLLREWVLVCDAGERTGCLVAWEPPGQRRRADAGRRFDAIWTTDRDVVRAAGRVCCGLAAGSAASEAAAVAARLDEPVASDGGELARAEAVTQRMIAYLAAGA
jgi:DICT domain-containing protein/predicted DNA-binding transcriptional regulator AlpA